MIYGKFCAIIYINEDFKEYIMEKRILVVSSANMDFVMNMHSLPSAGQTVIDSGSYNYAGGSSPTGDARYNSIRQMINSGNISGAEKSLYEIPDVERNAEWNFLMGCVMIRRGQYVDAQRYFDIAVSMDPYNNEYRAAQERLRTRANGYGGGYQTTSAGGCSACDVCSGLMCADCCCECCGGDLISCC